MDELLKRMSFASGLSEDEIRAKIEEKKDELSGLISDEGAAYIVAKEMGIAVVQQQRLNIESVVPGMQNVDVTGKIIAISPVREFKTEKAQGKVVNVTIADETGSLRMSLWNEEVEKIQDFKQGDVIRVKGYVKEDNIGGAEIRLGRYGMMAKSSEVVNAVETKRRAERSSISELREGQFKEIKVAVVQVFEGNVFYEVCPECKARLKEETDYKCQEHGEVQPEYGMILSCIVDDGTGNIRAVMFNEQAEKLLGMTKADAKKLFDRKKKLSAVLESVPLGKDIVFAGKVRRNNFFDRLEFVVSDVRAVDVKKEIEDVMEDEGK
jgi:ssDNA-binding replication factor A large subunit